ncbi:Avirulence protein [Noviherbaspirillum humi]|uniref:Avirulence protein n=1 Tax=Noviherbaspirillum humi TaxID=1688639 RepID=A0A239I1M0_9BURK|nr:hypothetical protein [Noviherbaspirillum humi]SNS87272.1 Avirulence protein [Noviherbaspirillum humi]
MSFPLTVTDRSGLLAGSRQAHFVQEPAAALITIHDKNNSIDQLARGQKPLQEVRHEEPVVVKRGSRQIKTWLLEQQNWDASTKRWRTVAIFADGYVEGPANRDGQEDSVRQKRLLITDGTGKPLTDPETARKRIQEIILNGGWTKLTAEQAQTIQERHAQVVTGPVKPTEFQKFKPRLPLTESQLQGMNMAQRYRWLAQAASRDVGKEAGTQLRQLLTPEAVGLLLGVAALQGSGAGIVALLINTGLNIEQARQIAQKVYEITQAMGSNNVYDLDQAAAKLAQVFGLFILLTGTAGVAKLLQALKGAAVRKNVESNPKTSRPPSNSASSRSASQGSRAIAPLSEREAGLVHQVPGFTRAPEIGKAFSQYMHGATVKLAKEVKAGRIKVEELWGALTKARYEIQKGIKREGAEDFNVDRLNMPEHMQVISSTNILTDSRYRPYANRIFKLFPDTRSWPDGQLRADMTGKIGREEIRLTSYEGSFNLRNGSVTALVIKSPLAIVLKKIFAHVGTLTKAALQEKNETIALAYLAQIHWWLAQACPNGRGSAAVAEAFVRTIALARGMKLGEWKVAPDLEALFMRMDDYVAAYPGFFENVSNIKNPPRGQ